MGIGKTLVKVAIGVLIAKGVASLTRGSSGGSLGGSTTTAGRGTRIDTGSKGGLEDMMGDVLGSGRSSGTRTPGQTGGGLGDLLDQISGQKRASPRATAPKGGLEDILGGLTGRSNDAGSPGGVTAGWAGGKTGGVGDLLDQVLGGKTGGGASGGGASGGRASGGELKTGPLTLPEPDREEELSAALMLRAVIQAVKCDGDLDDAERDRLMQAMGDADQSEVQAVQAELQRPVDVQGLARSVPAGLEPQVYIASLMAIDLDQRAEADYLNELAGALDLSPDQVNAIHDKAGVQRLYR